MLPQTGMIQEITPLDQSDFFIILKRDDVSFDHPAHWHNDFELNMVVGARGERFVGDSHEAFGELDIVLAGPRLPHVWKGVAGKDSMVVTIQFHEHLISCPTFNKRIFSPIYELLERAGRGISFSDEVKPGIRDRIIELTHAHGFDSALQFIALLDCMASAPNKKILASSSYQPEGIARESRSRRISLVCDYVNANYMEDIRLSDAARLTNMSDSAFCHFFKKKTGRNFVDYVNDVRIGHATQMLYETTNGIAEICYACGFNNTSNFIRVFKKKRGETPSQYRNFAQKVVTKF